ncbi:putative hydroxymethylpyrimidine transporter CytX [Clostridium vitabionis]|jgi:putative hydroxymethylpyrimidine transporter CytX|uniref:putative hydroxymethylpyrimidine transporter CytX n=1 Tax=Clostridium vitabionis TaxID=2784388 RepID=UPI00188A1071|nr:putative hydroxymethylpyrimidine transporter CytX [Clostridium vitabionis]
MEKKTSLFENGLIWFGAGVSIAEILTGTYFSGLGLKTGMAAILAGHLIGCLMFFLAGIISGNTGKSSMEAVKMSFGSQGGILFAILNVLQLVGWTAIMIYDGAISAGTIFGAGHALFAVIIGGLIIVWILIGITNLGKVNTVAMAALFLLTIILCVIIFRGGTPETTGDAMSFGAAVELSASMPLSWLPVIGDYTRDAKEPVKASLVSTIVYGLVSMWMFTIGMGASLFAGTSDIAEICVRAGLGIAGLLIIVFSTVTTTFLDALSAGISSESIVSRLNGKWVAVAASVIGIIGAILFNMDDITNFLYLIGSVFAPMVAVMIGTYFVLGTNSEHRKFDWVNLVIWLAGFILYRFLMRTDFAIGYTLPDMVITMLLTVLAGKIFPKSSRA